MAVRFAEPGARWRTVAYGPVLCLIVLVGDLIVTHKVHWFGLSFCALLLAGFVSLQVIAGRRHASVELTDTSLRDGTEVLDLADIAEIFPPRDEDAYDDEKWESARALGELSGVPRRRTGIGLLLHSGGMVQAWARDHYALRAELESALEGLPAAESDGIESAGPAKKSDDVAAASSADAPESDSAGAESGNAPDAGSGSAATGSGLPATGGAAGQDGESSGVDGESGDSPAESSSAATELAAEQDGQADR